MRRWPPKGVRHPDEYKGSDKLNIVWMQLPVSQSERRRIGKAWCAVLPTLSEVNRRNFATGRLGGYGSTVLGVLVLTVLTSLLVGADLSYPAQQAILGLLIVPMVALYTRLPHIGMQI